jgi:site-specific recombinase XerD
VSEISQKEDALPSNALLVAEANEYLAASRAQNTVRAYKSDWNQFVLWCQDHDQTPLPATPETVALYLTELARTHKPTSIQRKMSSITQAHLAANHAESPVKHALVRQIWRGIARTKGVAPQQKTPLLTPDIQKMARELTLSGTLTDKRNRALLLLGFAGAMRRSELVALEFGDITETMQGITLHIRRSKTDQEGQGRKVGIPHGNCPLNNCSATCPVNAFMSWCHAANITTGPLFRKIDRHGNIGTEPLSDQSVALILKHLAQTLGLETDGFAGHSLRSGLATSAAMAGVPERVIQDQTGHKSLPTLRKYIRDGSLFRENAVSKLGL